MKFFRQKEFFYPFIAWLLVFVWYLAVFPFLFSPARRSAQDLTDRLAGRFSAFPAEAGQVTVVEIDSESIKKIGQKWPWKRSLMAELVRAISFCHPRAIGFDIVFAGESYEDEDQALEQAFKEYSPVVLACTLARTGHILPLKRFSDRAWGTGFVNLPKNGRLLPLDEEQDPDHRELVARETALYAGEEKGRILAFPVALAAAYFALEDKEIRFVPGKGMYLKDKLFIPSRSGMVPINYLVDPLHEMKRISAAQVLEGKAEKRLLEDKIVLVGVTEMLAHDYAPTPVGVVPGVTINANILTMFLSERFVTGIPLWVVFVLAFLLGCAVILINSRLQVRYALPATAVLFLALFSSAVFLRVIDLRFDLFTVFFLCFTAFLLSAAIKYGALIYFSQRVKNLAIHDSLTGFFTPRFFLLKTEEQLKDRARALAVLVFTLEEYNKLVLALKFDEMKALIKSASGYFRAKLEKRFRDVLFSRLSVDSIAAAVPVPSLKEAEEFIKAFLQDMKNTEFSAGEKAFSLSFFCRGVYKPRGEEISGQEALAQIDSLAGDKAKNKASGYVLEQAEIKVWGREKNFQDTDMLDFLISDTEGKNRELEKMLQDLVEAKKDTDKAYFETIRSLIKALEEKDTYTQGHSERVARYARAVAEAAGLSFEECDMVYNAGLLHDIGKIGVPDYILRKKEQLTEEDYNMIRKHVLISAEILRPVKLFQSLIPIILAHHERYDGTGYPYGLGADMVSEGGLILAVADAFDAITCGRGYKSGLSVNEALKEMERGKGTQFSPRHVDILKEMISSGRLNLSL